jgi:hypothetical protein
MYVRFFKRKKNVTKRPTEKKINNYEKKSRHCEVLFRFNESQVDLFGQNCKFYGS